MIRRLTLGVAAIAVAFSGTIAGADACPPKSHNPGGTPPNCGHACPDGPITGPVNSTTGGALQDVLCAVHEGVEDATGISI